MKIIHVGPDSQFIQLLSGIFEEVAPGASQYLVTDVSPAGDLRFPVHGALSIPVPGKRGLASIPFHVRSCDMVIAHGMGLHGVMAFLASPKGAVRVWSGWGFDYYGDKKNPNAGLVMPATSAMMSDNKNPSIIKRTVRNLIAQGVDRSAKITDYFSAPIPSDFEVFRRRFKKFSGEYAQLNYGSVADTFAQGLAMGSGNNILVGNSASETNNHIDIFNILRKLDLSDRKVIVPLSYGDLIYRANVISAGEKILGKSFVPLVTFLSLDEYSNVLASCNIVIMNHLRQQALGNIGAALYQGAHVYLNSSNPVYQFFTEMGALTHSIQDLLDKPLPVKGLLDVHVAKNRAVLEGFWSREQIRANVEALLANIRCR